MTPEARVIKAFAASDIKCVALVDDAFDPPSVEEDDMGALLEVINSIKLDDFQGLGIALTQAEIDEACDLIGRSEYAQDAVLNIVGKVFRAFVTTEDARFDPNGQFRRIKGANLAYVRPILDLLKKCDPALQIVSCGSNPSDYDLAVRNAQLIFMDFFLKAGLMADGDPDPAQLEEARKASITRLKDLIAQLGEDQAVPTIIVMSSHDVENRIEEFQDEIAASKGQIFASRFDFVQKRQFETVDKAVTIQSPAFDVLLQLVQSFEFGMAMHLSLQEWRRAALLSIDDVWSSIARMKVKDFAYLMRFRLKDEGVALSEYLDWIFSEYLSDAVSRRVNWADPAFKVIDDPDGKASKILGAFDGPTNAVAEIFDRVRVEKPKDRPRRNYRMGDLYVSIQSPDNIYCIITPDCDLVVRKGDMKAPRLLMVSGKIHEIHKSEASVWDFVMIDGEAKNIQWFPKDIITHEKKKWAKPGNRGLKYRHVGTLRAMYAEDLRARVIAEYSRVGLNVAPTMSANRSAYLLIEGAAEDLKIELCDPGASACSVIFPRSTSDKPKVVFFESTVTKLISSLGEVDQGALTPEYAKALNDVVLKENRRQILFDKLCGTGTYLSDDKGVVGIYITAKPLNKGAKGRPWCQVVVATD